MPDSTENTSPVPCPLLPLAEKDMTWRDLQTARAIGAVELHQSALRYTQFLWLKSQPARAILALCRALYIKPESLPRTTRQPYAAYVWLLRHYNGIGFLGNPRISFLHQATRFRGQEPLKKMRAWALWHLTVRHLPHLPTNPAIGEEEPDELELAAYLDENGLPGEGTDFLKALRSK